MEEFQLALLMAVFALIVGSLMELAGHDFFTSFFVFILIELGVVIVAFFVKEILK